MSKWIKEIIVRYDEKQSFIYGNTLGEVVGELVRCKDCKWDKEPMRPKNVNCIYKHKPDDFCSYGQRKENE